MNPKPLMGGIRFFEVALEKFFRYGNRAHLPWRKKGIVAYEVWVSEIMLQQTQVSWVIGYYERFLKRFPTVESLARVSWEEFLPYYQGLGYYARGRNMLAAARVIVDGYDGKFPRNVEELEKLPGVGPYTAAAIASFAYGENTIAWDTNLHRVIGRFFFGSRHTDLDKKMPFRASRRSEESQSKKPGSLDKLGMTRKEFFEDRFTLSAKIVNAALMDFGSAICIARPKCANCPLVSRCRYFSEKGRNESCHQEGSLRDSKGRSLKGAPWKDARVFVILHENHKKYYSPYKTKFAPFVVPPSHNTRHGIKDWFRNKYNLELSVRPPHKKELVDGKPTLFVNSQVLTGKPGFSTFPLANGEKRALF